ncbi:hypothetical protein, partial [Sphingomonas ursincola]|uniref:hypothetical protein n=1 Tax=Sphingomonas ursincola TaxID=56361 RepID=UPI002353363F
SKLHLTNEPGGHRDRNRMGWGMPHPMRSPQSTPEITPRARTLTIAIAYINGMPLTAENEKVHIWRWWQPRFRWLGCQVLEAKNESPTRLSWQGKRLAVEHGFRPGELLDIRNQCGPVRVLIEKKFKPYS